MQVTTTTKNLNIFKPRKKDAEDNEGAKEDPTFDEYHNMKGKEEDDDDKPKSTQLIGLSAHVELEQQPNYAGSQWMQVREAASSMELIILQTYYMFRLLSERRNHFHIGGFWDFYVQIHITKMILSLTLTKNKNYWLETCLLG